jgi:MFS family permease
LLVLLLAVTLVGLPVAAVLLFGLLVGFVFGPVPVVTALGDRLLRGRGGLFGAFLLGAVLWRLGIWLIPVVGGVLFLVALVWGIGAWVMAGWQQRRVSRPESELLPPAMGRRDEPVPEGWDYPLPPSNDQA